MAIRYRPMEPRDVRACAAVIARHPVVASRYGEAIQYLAPAWLKLIGSDGFVAAVFEEQQGSKTTVLGAGVATFVTDEFVRELKTPRHYWIGPEIVRRIHQGRSPVLSDKQVSEANTAGGLNVAVWHTGVSPEDLARPEAGNSVMASFIEMHRGFLLKELVFQVETVEHVGAVRAIGAFFWNVATRCYGPLTLPAETVLKKCHVLGLTAELGSHLHGFWGASIFVYQRPRFGFSRSEQRLLSCGMAGGTDGEIADELGISLVGVRKRWRTIYERVGTIAPELSGPNGFSREGETSERGRAKKQRVLAYVRNHPEELRPVCRTLLKREAQLQR
jgi:DNA-binding CsgD family transcriptional regulator